MNKEPHKFPGRFYGDGVTLDDLPSYTDVRNNDYEPKTYVSQPLMKLISRVEPNMIPLMEILPTIEGEGLYIGTPRTLVRVGGCAVGCSWCFPGNTKIMTSAGQRYIMDIKPGDIVYARVDGESKPTVVEEVMEQEVFVTDLCQVSILSERQRNVWELDSFISTKDHPIEVKDVEAPGGSKFVEAGKLENRQVLAGFKSNLIEDEGFLVDTVVPELDPVMLSKIGAVNRTARVFNLKCSPYNTYTILLDSGKHVSVHNCDTKHSWGMKFAQQTLVDEVARMVLEQTNAKEISITGGEPMHYPLQVSRLCDIFHGWGYKLNLETSGLILNYRLFEKFDFIGMDIKTPSSGVHLTEENINMIVECAYWHGGLQLKAVISSMEDLEFIMSKFHRIIKDDSGKVLPLVFTPCADTTNGPADPKELHAITQMVRDWDKGYNIRIIPQIHKLLNFA